MDLEHYHNKEAVWGYDELTQSIQERIDNMPDLPRHVAVLLTWSDEEDETIYSVFRDTGAIYDVLALQWIGKPLRLFFLALEPDSPLGHGAFLAGLVAAKFSECFLLKEGKAVIRSIKLESVEEAEHNHRERLREMREASFGDLDQ